jgi:hypothetical protein
MLNYEKKIWLGTIVGAFLPFIIYLLIFNNFGRIFLTLIVLTMVTITTPILYIKSTKDERLKDTFTSRQFKNRPFIASMINMSIGSIIYIILSYFVF